MGDLYQFLRSKRVSQENANEAERIKYEYAKEYAKQECEKARVKYMEVITKLNKRIQDLSTPATGFAEMVANAIKSNPDLFANSLKGVITQHLSLDNDCVPYSGNYARLTWDKEELGSICIEHYSDD